MAMRQLYPDSFSKFFSLPGRAAAPMDEMLIREDLMQRKHTPTADLAI
jgi:hypothetical protein